MRIETIKAHESFAIEAIVHLVVVFPALRASNAAYITTLSNGRGLASSRRSHRGDSRARAKGLSYISEKTEQSPSQAADGDQSRSKSSSVTLDCLSVA